jgi:hypothetical protein
MLGARTASEIAATTKRFSELLLIKNTPHRVVGPRSSDHLERQSRGCRGLLPSFKGCNLITFFQVTAENWLEIPAGTGTLAPCHCLLSELWSRSQVEI